METTPRSEGEEQRVAEAVRALVAEVDAFYPRDVWPEASDDQMASLHAWARAAHGLPDGSRFHVAGIRHALHLIQLLAEDNVERSGLGDSHV